jgi:hypothetical protein
MRRENARVDGYLATRLPKAGNSFGSKSWHGGDGTGGIGAVLPAFELDCRDWLVITPGAGVPDELDGTPVLAMLSTGVVESDQLHSASATITLGLLDEDVPPATPVGAGSIAAELIEPEGAEGSVRYVVPAPVGNLALLAEFDVTGGINLEVWRRIQALMASFRWVTEVPLSHN